MVVLSGLGSKNLVLKILCLLNILPLSGAVWSMKREDTGQTLQYEKIAFMHLRKTGGSYVDGVLWRAYRHLGLSSGHLYSFDMERCKNDMNDDYKNCSTIDPGFWDDGCGLCRAAWKNETKGCNGCVEWVAEKGFAYVELHHFDFSLAHKLKHQHGFKIVTILREPSKQFESDANYEAYSRGGALGHMPGYEKGFKGFSKWVEDRRGPFEQLRMVSGCSVEHGANSGRPNALDQMREELDAKDHPACTFDQPMFAKPSEFRWAYGNPEGKMSPEMRTRLLAQASANLDDIDLIGMSDDMPATMALLQAKFPFLDIMRGVQEVTNAEKNKRDHVFKLNQLTRIHHNHLSEEMAADEMFYEIARRRFEREVTELGIPLREPPVSLIQREA